MYKSSAYLALSALLRPLERELISPRISSPLAIEVPNFSFNKRGDTNTSLALSSGGVPSTFLPTSSAIALIAPIAPSVVLSLLIVEV